MFSFRQQDIKNARVNAAIAKARRENGVHIYMDVPDTKINRSFSTTLANLQSTGSKDLTWTVLCRAAGDEPVFYLWLANEDNKSALSSGILQEGSYSTYIQEEGKWYPANPTVPKYKWKTGQYVVIGTHFIYPQGTTVEPVKFTLNGGEHTKTGEFKKVKNFAKFGAIVVQDSTSFQNIEILEHHFLYSGITAGLPPRGSKGKYISFDKASICFLSQGSTAVIVGHYMSNTSHYKGIMIGVATSAQSVPKDFASHNDTNEHVTFRVSVGFMDVAITTEKEHKSLAMTIGPQDDAWLIVDNINILNLEIHTGTKSRNT